VVESSVNPYVTILTILFKPFGFLAPKGFSVMSLSNCLILSVPDEGYTKNVPCALNEILTPYKEVIMLWVLSLKKNTRKFIKLAKTFNVFI
jgi:hypothetical protein